MSCKQNANAGVITDFLFTLEMNIGFYAFLLFSSIFAFMDFVDLKFFKSILVYDSEFI